MVVRYEDLSRDFDPVLRSISRWVGIRLRPVCRPVAPHAGTSHLPRKGIVGDWRTVFSAEDEAFVMRTVESVGLSWDAVAVDVVHDKVDEVVSRG